MSRLVPIFDLDGTLLDSDAALVAAFLRLGVPLEDISFGHPIAPECERLGLTVRDYVDAYDANTVQPFDRIGALVSGLDRWGLCSNKARTSAVAELDRLGWSPDAAMFAEDFDGAPKALGPLLDAMGLAPCEALFVGDTPHDERCAHEAGVAFVWAGWNRRTLESRPPGTVLLDPVSVLDLIG